MTQRSIDFSFLVKSVDLYLFSVILIFFIIAFNTLKSRIIVLYVIFYVKKL